ncbi:MAG: DUF664 domain-containing protein [Rhodococcus sp. (in: high G+C Gram-positive bacteria)]|nr:MAG: DUF664 domain-containing protein [Rhodococcus sp. (in: high G+C Gram-positive bacteria)]
MDQSALLTDAFDRIQETVHSALADLQADALTFRVDAKANTIAWLVWHLTRVQDDHVAGVARSEQVWTSRGWVERFDLPFRVADIGYGHSADEVARVQTGSDLLREYHDAVHDRTVDYVQSIGADDLDRIVDEHWDPPVTLGVRLISVVSDDLQHAGQAAYVRGIYERR